MSECKLKQIDVCGDDPVNDGDCCFGYNKKGDCVKGKWNSEKGECFVKEKLSAKRIIAFTMLVLFFIFAIYTAVRFWRNRSPKIQTI